MDDATICMIPSFFYVYMSYHMSFTSEYIYSDTDHKKVRDVLEKAAGGKYFDIFTEMEGHGIIAGKLCDGSPSVYDWELPRLLKGITTDDKIRFVIIKENGCIEVLDKLPNGDVFLCTLDNEDIKCEWEFL